MPKTLKELAVLLQGELVGSPDIKIKNILPLEEADKDSLVFVLDQKFIPQAEASKAAAVVAHKKFKLKNKPAILVMDARLALAKALAEFYPEKRKLAGIHKTAAISKSAKIGANSYIGNSVTVGDNSSVGKNSEILANVSIGDNVEIGEGAKIYPNAAIYDNVKVGKRCRIHSGAVIGIDGYGFAPSGEEFIKIPQVGAVIIGDDVEIFANTTVARGTMGNTIIGSGTKIDCLAHIAHNCVIGKNCAITGQAAMAGSVTLGSHVSVGGQVGFRDHITIGDNTVVLARSGVTKNIPANSVVSGFPAKDHREELRLQAALHNLSKKSKPSKTL